MLHQLYSLNYKQLKMRVILIKKQNKLINKKLIYQLINRDKNDLQRVSLLKY